MTPSLRIGKIPFLNCVLFFHGLENNAGFELTPLVPRALSGAAADGVVDAGPVPLVDTWNIENRYIPLGDFCIATTEQARSVFLFSKRPFDELEGAEIGITEQTSTSVRLLKGPRAHVWHAQPARFVPVGASDHDAFLLIGDDALLRRRGVDGHPHMADLGEVWTKWTGLPFVFARWVARRDLCDDDVTRLGAILERSLSEGWDHLDRLAATHADRLNMSVDEVREYLRGFHFRMSAAEHEAARKFRELDAAMRRHPSPLP
jgi:chorismate dehydratase